jgi:hypothetical protein
MQPDPLFAVRVLSDGPDILTVVVGTVTPLIGLLGVYLGARQTYRATRAAERERFNDETRHLALSIAAEVQAGRWMVDVSIKIAASHDLEFNLDTLTYSEPPANGAPIMTAAAASVGRFPPDIAARIAKMLILLANLRQATLAIGAMARAGALTKEKKEQRTLALTPVVKELLACADELLGLIKDAYGPLEVA